MYDVDDWINCLGLSWAIAFGLSWAIALGLLAWTIVLGLNPHGQLSLPHGFIALFAHLHCYEPKDRKDAGLKDT
jgi:hypothetical protein